MTENAITTVRPIFAVSDADKRAAAALKMMLPYGKDLTDDNALALLLYGRQHGLDPLNGECYFLVHPEYTDKSGEFHPRTELGCYPGIKGKRAKAKEQLRQADQQATYRTEYSLEKAETIGLDPAKTKLVVKAELRDSISEGNYIMNVLKLSQAGFTKDEIGAMIGKPPRWVGYGVVTNQEAWRLKQPPLTVARKRAESDAISQRFDLPMMDITADQAAPEIIGQLEAGDTSENGQTAPMLPDVTDGEYKPSPRSEAEILKDLGYDAEPKGAWTLDTARAVKLPDGTELGMLSFANLRKEASDKSHSDELRSAASWLVENWK